MKSKRIVLLLGGSLILSTIGTLIKNHDDLEVIHADTDISRLGQLLLDSNPDVVIFDLATFRPDMAISILALQPQLLIIGINLVNSTMLVICSQQARAVTADDLLSAILVDYSPLILNKECL